MADTKLVICEKCLGTGHVNGGDENSTWSKTCEDCHGSGFSRVKITNEDRIRAMSDEELAKMLTVLVGGVTCFECRKIGGGKCSMKCEEQCLEWLKQPAEGE